MSLYSFAFMRSSSFMRLFGWIFFFLFETILDRRRFVMLHFIAKKFQNFQRHTPILMLFSYCKFYWWIYQILRKRKWNGTEPRVFSSIFFENVHPTSYKIWIWKSMKSQLFSLVFHIVSCSTSQILFPYFLIFATLSCLYASLFGALFRTIYLFSNGN